MSKKSILVVDNEDDQRHLLQSLLSRFGYDVTTAASAKEALEVIACRRFHLIITDLIMPDMDGIDLCERVKEIRPATKVFSFSGHTGLYDTRKLEIAGFDGFLHKPTDMKTIGEVLETAIGAP